MVASVADNAKRSKHNHETSAKLHEKCPFYFECHKKMTRRDVRASTCPHSTCCSKTWVCNTNAVKYKRPKSYCTNYTKKKKRYHTGSVASSPFLAHVLVKKWLLNIYNIYTCIPERPQKTAFKKMHSQCPRAAYKTVLWRHMKVLEILVAGRLHRSLRTASR